VERLKKLTPQELVREINELKAQLQEANSQLKAQVEIKPNKKLFFPFVRK
jgi:ribosomal protein L29